MYAPNLARIFGLIYVLVGVLGFVPGISQPVGTDAPHLALDQFYNNILGIFAVNWLHDAVHILVGIWAIAASASLGASRTFFRTIAVVFALLFVLGIIPTFYTLFGLTPLYGADSILHLLTALFAFYCGWGAPAQPRAAAA